MLTLAQCLVSWDNHLGSEVDATYAYDTYHGHLSPALQFLDHGHLGFAHIMPVV